MNPWFKNVQADISRPGRKKTLATITNNCCKFTPKNNIDGYISVRLSNFSSMPELSPHPQLPSLLGSKQRFSEIGELLTVVSDTASEIATKFLFHSSCLKFKNKKVLLLV
ncbi:hypothetical protein AVEN_222699-1 [Araneus ventricosus]|uniref:Uncharacterized protein n=1 Tax=Araneus ventricosus TaxID=182803 RepID=A0A4Y2AYP0_ARAVE|nr:hypothetical protein AVEN_222699-1 [Araneus ventricosus]